MAENEGSVSSDTSASKEAEEQNKHLRHLEIEIALHPC
jgi:hypothetical protein